MNMARRRKRSGHTDRDPEGVEDTSESAPPAPKQPKARRKTGKRLGPRWNLLTTVEGPSAAPDFPRIS